MKDKLIEKWQNELRLIIYEELVLYNEKYFDHEQTKLLVTKIINKVRKAYLKELKHDLENAVHNILGVK